MDFICIKNCNNYKLPINPMIAPNREPFYYYVGKSYSIFGDLIGTKAIYEENSDSYMGWVTMEFMKENFIDKSEAYREVEKINKLFSEYMDLKIENNVHRYI